MSSTLQFNEDGSLKIPPLGILPTLNFPALFRFALRGEIQRRIITPRAGIEPARPEGPRLATECNNHYAIGASSFPIAFDKVERNL